MKSKKKLALLQCSNPTNSQYGLGGWLGYTTLQNSLECNEGFSADQDQSPSQKLSI
jgi:hypothetical protein